MESNLEQKQRVLGTFDEKITKSQLVFNYDSMMLNEESQIFEVEHEEELEMSPRS